MLTAASRRDRAHRALRRSAAYPVTTAVNEEPGPRGPSAVWLNQRRPTQSSPENSRAHSDPAFGLARTSWRSLASVRSGQALAPWFVGQAPSRRLRLRRELRPRRVWPSSGARSDRSPQALKVEQHRMARRGPALPPALVGVRPETRRGPPISTIETDWICPSAYSGTLVPSLSQHKQQRVGEAGQSPALVRNRRWRA